MCTAAAPNHNVTTTKCLSVRIVAKKSNMSITTTTNTTAFLGPEKSCVDVVGKAAEDSHHILTPVRNIVHNISSKTSKECIDIGISASSPDGVRKNNVLGENRSKILKRRRQQQQQYGADECRQEVIIIIHPIDQER